MGHDASLTFVIIIILPYIWTCFSDLVNMSLWKRIQRIGMKAAKFQFTVSLEELTVNFEKEYRPKGIVIVFARRGRRCTSQVVAKSLYLS